MDRVVEVRRVPVLPLLRFALVANVVLVGALVAVVWLVWWLVEQLRLVDDVCGLLLDIGVETCAFDLAWYAPVVWQGAGVLLVAGLLLSLFAVAAFNLIAELFGGLQLQLAPLPPLSRRERRVRRRAAGGGADEVPEAREADRRRAERTMERRGETTDGWSQTLAGVTEEQPPVPPDSR